MSDRLAILNTILTRRQSEMESAWNNYLAALRDETNPAKIDQGISGAIDVLGISPGTIQEHVAAVANHSIRQQLERVEREILTASNGDPFARDESKIQALREQRLTLFEQLITGVRVGDSAAQIEANYPFLFGKTPSPFLPGAAEKFKQQLDVLESQYNALGNKGGAAATRLRAIEVERDALQRLLFHAQKHSGIAA